MKKKLAAVLVCFGLLALLGGKWLSDRYVLYRWQLLPRDAAVLDLREETLEVTDFARLQEKLPHSRIVWNVPFQGNRVSSEEETLHISTLAEEDIALLQYFPELKLLDASGCVDYENLRKVSDAYPQVQLRYQVSFGNTKVENDQTAFMLKDPSGEELTEKLQWLPELKELTLTGTLPEPEALAQLQQAYPDREIRWEIPLGENRVMSDAEVLDLRDSALTAEEVAQALRWLPRVKTVDLTGSTLPDEDIMALADTHDCFFLWQMTLGSKKFSTDVAEIDISRENQESTAFIESRLPYFPNLEKVIMSHCGLDNETMDDLNRRYADIRFVWTVKIKYQDVRTDETWFYPVKLDRSAVVESKDLVDLRYCTDMVCIDVGHMWGVKDCEWAAYMPNLRYLVLAYTSVADLTPLSGLKNLAFLEIFHTPVTDYSPLIGCTGLEDLNLSMTTGDYRPLAQMPWLKNVRWAGVAGSYGLPCSGAHEALPAAQPQVNWDFYGKYAAYKSDWRKLPNYYAMRDFLGMFYLR